MFKEFTAPFLLLLPLLASCTSPYAWQRFEITPDLYFGEATKEEDKEYARGLEELMKCCTRACEVYHRISDTGMKDLQSESVSAELGALVTEARDALRKAESYKLYTTPFPPGTLWQLRPAHGPAMNKENLFDEQAGCIAMMFTPYKTRIVDLSRYEPETKLRWLAALSASSPRPPPGLRIHLATGHEFEFPATPGGGPRYLLPMEYEIRILSERHRTVCVLMLSSDPTRWAEPSMKFEDPFGAIVIGDRVASIKDLIAEIKR